MTGPQPPGESSGAPTAQAWAQAALDEIEVVGVRALTVETAARRLGTDRTGCYHHFGDRRALLRGALHLWEARYVVGLGRELGAVADPRERLRTVLQTAVVDLRPSVIVQLMAANEDPDVAAVLARAAEARLALLTRALLEVGQPADVARRRAVLVYAAYLGFAHLRLQVPDHLDGRDRLRALVDEMESLVLAADPV